MPQGRCKVRAWGGFSPPPMFGQTVNPISTRGADYARHSTTSPPRFSDLATGLDSCKRKKDKTEFNHFTCEKYFTCILLHCLAHQITKELYLDVTAALTILQTVSDKLCVNVMWPIMAKITMHDFFT